MPFLDDLAFSHQDAVALMADQSRGSARQASRERNSRSWTASLFGSPAKPGPDGHFAAPRRGHGRRPQAKSGWCEYDEQGLQVRLGRGRCQRPAHQARVKRRRQTWSSTMLYRGVRLGTTGIDMKTPNTQARLDLAEHQHEHFECRITTGPLRYPCPVQREEQLQVSPNSEALYCMVRSGCGLGRNFRQIYLCRCSRHGGCSSLARSGRSTCLDDGGAAGDRAAAELQSVEV